jgi:hypothetical protein
MQSLAGRIGPPDYARMEEEMNKRYLAYCNSNSKTVEEQIFSDFQTYPGGVMCGFICWMRDKIKDFRMLNGIEGERGLTIAEHLELDKFLEEEVKGVKQ